MKNLPRDHHVVPQFYLRNFAVDEAQKKVSTVAKIGRKAIWMERSIKNIGVKRDYYVHFENDRPVSVELNIGKDIETPLAQSDTWHKIVTGQEAQLDRSDRPILYALVRHFEARNPHFKAVMRELTELAINPNSDIPFTQEEREMHSVLAADPDFAGYVSNQLATRKFDQRDFDSCFMLILRSPIPLRTLTTPTWLHKAPQNSAIDLPLPGMIPFQRILALNTHAFVCLIEGDFGGEFQNVEIDRNTALGFNRSCAAYFAFFPEVQHLICRRDQLIDDLTWAPYRLISETPKKVIFERLNDH